MRSILLTVLFLLFSCGPQEERPELSRSLSCEIIHAQNYPIGVALGAGLSDQEVLSIEEALFQIEEEVGEQVFVLSQADKWEHDRCGMVFLSKGDVPPSPIEGAETQAYTWNRFTLNVPSGNKYICTSVIHLARDIPLGRVNLAVRHELYHAVGLGHSEESYSVMNEMPYDDAILLDRDREFVRNSVSNGNDTACNI